MISENIKKVKLLDWLFAVEIVLFGLIITGFLPREMALYLGVALVIYFLATPLDDVLVFFVRSIPLFLALPITVGFDNFNTWRILAAIIFLKWLFKNSIKYYVLSIKEYLKKLNHKRQSFLLIVLFVIAAFSIIPALDKIAAVKRIIFLLNFAILGVVIYDKIKCDTNNNFTERLIKNSIIPVVIVAAVGYVQVISTYFIDIYQFMRIWGEGIQCRQFGEQWCNIAVWVGNTWFAYYGDQLSLRVFSLFPDSHSFPQFVLLGIPAVFAIMWQRITNLKKQIQLILSLALLFLIIILSGTRGIWVASIGVILLATAIIFFTSNYKKQEKQEKPTGIKLAIASFIPVKEITKYLTLFFLMFSIAFPIFSSPQFLVNKSDDLLKQRIKSIIDFEETSNTQRIEIWKKTLSSIKEKPLLGVGIGNYPVVLKQDIRLAKAGSSAHNLYLHIMAEMGIMAGIIFIWFLWLIFKKNYEIVIKPNMYLYDDRGKITIWPGNLSGGFLTTYFTAMLLYLPWVLIYSLTDIAIFDERTFLIFIMVLAIILGTKNSLKSE